MNVLTILTTVMKMLTVQILTVALHVLACLDSREMELHVQVCELLKSLHVLMIYYIVIVALFVTEIAK